MRSNISRRLRMLEQKAHIHDAPQPVIFVTFVSPGSRTGPSVMTKCGSEGHKKHSRISNDASVKTYNDMKTAPRS